MLKEFKMIEAVAPDMLDITRKIPNSSQYLLDATYWT